MPETVSKPNESGKSVDSKNQYSWLPLGSLWLPLGSLWPSFGIPLGSLWVALGSLVAPWGPPWPLSWKSLKIDPPGGPKVDFSIDVCSGIGCLELIRGFRGSRGFPGFPGSGVINYGSGPPFHARRGSG